MMSSEVLNIVVTLAEKDHFKGASVLLNSLIRKGFSGMFLVGTKGDGGEAGREFQRCLDRSDKDQLPVEVKVFDVATDWHMTNIKARVMADVFDDYPDAKSVVYIDPDIVVTCPWTFLVDWTQEGVVLAGDVNWRMPSNHPIRNQWKKILKKEGETVMRSPELYFNAGLVGLSRKTSSFAGLWHQLTKSVGGMNNPLDKAGDIGQWREPGRWQTMMTPDQDALNLTAMASEHSLSTAGPDAMAFVPGDFYFPHAVGSLKPWRRNYLKDMIFGRGPRLVDKVFWAAAEGPVSMFSSGHIRRKKFEMSVAGLVGRFYHRR